MMLRDFRLVGMKNSPLQSEMATKYASLGYFHYQYIKSLDSLNSCENLVRDNGVTRGNGEVIWKEGNFITLSVVDFSKKKKITCRFSHPHHRMRLSVGDLIDLCEYVHSSLRVDSSNCFVKFDAYTIV